MKNIMQIILLISFLLWVISAQTSIGQELIIDGRNPADEVRLTHSASSWSMVESEATQTSKTFSGWAPSYRGLAITPDGKLC